MGTLRTTCPLWLAVTLFPVCEQVVLSGVGAVSYQRILSGLYDAL